MTSLPASGPLSFPTIRSFFDITNGAFNLSYLYNKLQSFPTSGTISLSNCYGKSKKNMYSFSSFTISFKF